MGSLHEHNRSLWASGVEDLRMPALKGKREVDVVVVGGGITGLLTAWCCQRDGASVALVEAGPIGGGATGYTSAKVSVLQGTTYDELRRRHGPQAARTYAEAHGAGLDLIASVVDELGIDCDWERRPAYTYAVDAEGAKAVTDEALAARAAGVDAELVDDAGLPFPVEAALRVGDQAQFDSLRFAQGVARAIVDRGGAVYEHSRALGLQEGPRASTVPCAEGSVSAPHVVVATHLPYLDRGVYFARTSAVRSYCIALTTPDPLPDGMYLETGGGATRSLRTARDGSVLIVGGEGHTVGQEPDTTVRYGVLQNWAQNHWTDIEVLARWSAQDYTAVDGLPFIGPNRPGPGAPLVATAFRKWGISGGAAAALILADRVAGRDNPWADRFTPLRLNLAQSAAQFARTNADTSVRLVRDRLAAVPPRSAADLAPGEGAVVLRGARLIAAHRDDEGVLHGVSPRCTHLGCWVTWNTAERSWDCPCHASRFDPDGRVLEGPAVRDLPAREL